MKKLLAAAVLAVTCSAQAYIVTGFTGDYAPGNWTQTPGTGSVNSFNATELSLTSGADGSDLPSAKDVGITIGQPSVKISFDWDFSTSDDLGPFYDPFGILTQLAIENPPPLFTVVVDLLGAMAQSGSFSVQLSQGDFFAFSQQTIDNFPGAATTRISNFRVEGLRSVPEPSSLILLAAAMIAAGAVSRRRVV